MVQKVVLEVSVVTLVLIEHQDLVQELLLSQLQLLLRAITYFHRFLVPMAEVIVRYNDQFFTFIRFTKD